MSLQDENKKILLVEDNQFLYKVYGNRLRDSGYQVEILVDGGEVVKKVTDWQPDLILLDLILPDKNGFDLLKEIKSDNSIKEIPIIIISNLGQDSDIKLGLDLGAVDYLVKADYSLQQVEEKIKEHLK